MPQIIDFDCENCPKNDKSCCKYCFNKTETNIFSCLTSKEIGLLVEGKKVIKYKPGETIIKQNEISTCAVCMKEGLAKIYVEGSFEKKSIIKLISKHNFTTGGGLFYEEKQPFTISAITPVTCCIIDSIKLEELFSKNKRFASMMIKYHTIQSNYLINKLINFTQKYMPGRVAETLLYLKNKIFECNPFTVPLTRQELAEMSNMTKESFVRKLQEFKNANLIKTKGNKFEIIDEELLFEISNNG